MGAGEESGEGEGEGGVDLMGWTVCFVWEEGGGVLDGVEIECFG